MKRFSLLTMLGLWLFLGAATPPHWAALVRVTPSGSYITGNPAARVKLVEYLSFTCSHCADFARDTAPSLLRDYVNQGKISIDIRHALRDQMDFAAALLARCDGPRRYAAHADALFHAQGNWLTTGIFFVASNTMRLSTLPVTRQLQETAKGAGLDKLMMTRGMTAARVNTCIASPTQQKLLLAQASEAWDKRKIEGTPYFLLNGSAIGSPTWYGLKSRLDAAIR